MQEVKRGRDTKKHTDMKFVVSASVLLRHLTDVSKIMSAKVNMSMLNYAALMVRDQMLTLRYTDTMLTIVTRFPLEAIEEEGEVCVPLRLLMESVKETPNVPLHFDIDAEQKTAKVIFDDGLRQGNWSFTVERIEEYYELPELDEGRATQVEMTTDIAEEGLDKTLFCAASSNANTNQINVSTVHIEFTPEGVWFAATDLFRVGRYENTKVRQETRSSVTLPSKAAQVISALLPSTAEALQISFDDRIVLFSTPSIQVYSLLSDNRFPEVEQFFKQSISHEVVVNTRLLLDSVRQLAPFSTPSTMNARYAFSNSMIELEAYSETYEASAKQVIACEYSGGAFTIMLSIPLLSESLSKMSSQEVKLQFDEYGRFVLIRPAQPEAEEVDYAIYVSAMLQ